MADSRNEKENKQNVITLSQLGEHSTLQDLWIAVHGKGSPRLFTVQTDKSYVPSLLLIPSLPLTTPSKEKTQENINYKPKLP